MIRNRSDQDKAQVRQAMLQATSRMLIQDGYRALTLAKVAREVGFTTTNVYRYFNTKDDLIYAAIDDSFAELGQRLEAARLSTSDPLERIFALSRAYVQFAADQPAAYHLMFVEKTDYLFGTREVPGLDKLAYLSDAVAEAGGAGLIRQSNAQATAHAIWGQLHGVLTLTGTMPLITAQQAKEAIQETFELMRRSLKP